MKKQDLWLSEFRPQSELIVERRQVVQPKFPIIDAHTHFGPLVLGENYGESYDTAEVVEQFKAAGVKKVVNAETVWDDALDELLAKIHPHEDFVITFSSLNVSKLDEPDFESYVRRILRQSKDKGVQGLKFWKDIGLTKKDKQGRYIPVDDPRLQVIWATAAELNLPILFHIADPVAFFKPLSPTNERFEELVNHPEWSFYHPDLFTFEELMDQQENLLSQNPNTTFILAHGGSYSENLGQVGCWLETYPNMYVDIAARLAEFGRQPYTARDFFLTHQDRILFGTDAIAGYPFSYQPYLEYLETWNEYFDYSSSGIAGQGRWKIYGIGLEDSVLEKIYYKNAQRILGL